MYLETDAFSLLLTDQQLLYFSHAFTADIQWFDFDAEKGLPGESPL